MAYKTEIQIGVKGAKELEQAIQRIQKLSNQIDQINKREIFGTKQVASVNEYTSALQRAQANLNKTRIQLDAAGNATKTYKKAIDQYVSALGASNRAQQLTNSLVEQEIILRERAARIKALPKAVATTQFDSPIGPGPASPISSRPKPGRTGLERFGEFGLGAGFPLLFGGGAGQVLGGALGTAIGGATPAAFGLQIAFSAIGGQIEDATKRVRDLDRAIQTLDLSALADSTLLVNAELREAVQRFVDLGESQKAVKLLAQETFLQTGLLPESIRESADATLLLSNAWDESVGAVSGLVALLTADLLNSLAVTLKLVNAIVKGINTIAGKVRELGSNELVKLALRILPILGPLVQAKDTLDALLGLTKEVSEAEEERLFSLKQSGKELEIELGREKEIFAIEQRRVAGTKAAAKLNNAQVSRDLDLAKLRQATEDKILDKRREFAGITDQIGLAERDHQISLINQSAEIERQRILKKYSLDETAAGLQREKELRKQIFETRVQESKIAQVGVQAQLDQLANEEKIFQIRQQTAAATVELERARFDAQLSTLQLQEAGLQRELEGLRQKQVGFNRQLALVNAIAENQKKQARIQNEIAKLENAQGITRAKIAQQQIRFEVQRIKLQLQMVQLKAQEIKDDAQRAAKLREVAATEQQVLALTKEMVSAGNKRLETAIKIARQKDIVADNILKGKLESIEAERVEARRATNAARLAKATGQAADEAARLNRNMSKGSSGGGASSQTVSTSMPIDPDVEKAVMERAGPFGYRNIFELVEKLEEAQKIKNARTARTAQMSSPGSSSFASSGSYTPRAFSGGGGGTATANVNIKTGPVLEFDGKRYMTMEDFERGVSELASAQAQRSRSFGARRYGGIS